MDLSISSALDRCRRRRSILGAVLAVTLLHLLLGGLAVRWALLGLALVVLWAALWPELWGELWPAPDGSLPATGAPASEPAGLAGDGGALRALPLALLEGLPDAALVLDARGLTLAANSAAQALSPVIRGRALSHWSRSPELLVAADRARETGTLQRCHMRSFTPVERSLDVTITPVSGDAQDAPPVLLVLLRDLTEQENVARMRVDFVANASHELRTPLASLRGFIETLQGAARSDPAAQARFLGIMQAQAERMSRLIDDLLSLSRIEMREHVLPTARVDIAAVARDSAMALRSAATAAGLTIEERDTAAPVQVTGERDELMQVAQNLIQNAVKYGRQGGRVTVSVRREGARVALEVADDGIGIAAEHIPRLTERFYRVSAKESKERGGTGLGLAIVKHIVNRHRGELRIASTPGHGSTFTVLLPAAAN